MPPEKYNPEIDEKLKSMGDEVSQVLVAIMERDTLPARPELDEIVAAAWAVQYILSGATALGIATYWGSGGLNSTRP